ncbi:hypothetical protein JTE90_010840 [Oedothorax gibbosus]|uniref:Uncharacterized protein n=1 Tax=Oedothorax gibbosus TaxID=931172 RepID=A0AAV6V5M4_9ARAC|nr:hypothetical protein JTE90_010840 [Oedothorax gibbosus]
MGVSPHKSSKQCKNRTSFKLFTNPVGISLQSTHLVWIFNNMYYRLVCERNKSGSSKDEKDYNAYKTDNLLENIRSIPLFNYYLAIDKLGSLISMKNILLFWSTPGADVLSAIRSQKSGDCFHRYRFYCEEHS